MVSLKKIEKMSPNSVLCKFQAIEHFLPIIYRFGRHAQFLLYRYWWEMKPVTWTDIVLKYPEATIELPEETIFVDWNHGWQVNHFGNISELQNLGFSFMGTPSIRCQPDHWYAASWPIHFKNPTYFS